MTTLNLKEMKHGFTACEEVELPRYFKEFNIYENLAVPCGVDSEYTLDLKVGNLKIISAKIINTIKGLSIEGQYLTGKKLVLMGYVDISIYFKPRKKNGCSNEFNNAYVLEKSMSFSTFIVIPNPVCDENIIDLRYIIEDGSLAKVSDNKVLISTTIFIEYNDKKLIKEE